LEELPIFNWWKINQGDYTYVFKEKREIKEKELETILSLYRDLLAQYVKEIGVSGNYKRVLMQQKEIARLKLNYIATMDKTLFTEIDIAQRELKDLIGNEETVDFNETKAFVDKQLGFRIDPRTTSVLEYNGYINIIQKSSSNG